MGEAFKVEIRGSVEGWTEDLEKRVGEAVGDNMLKAAELAAGALRKEIFTSFRPGTSKLARSYTATLLEPKNKKLRSGALSDLIYARIQDEGGEIVPRVAKALAIPVSSQAKSLSRSGVGPREFPSELDLIWPKGRDSGFLMDEQGKLHYSLQKSVQIPGEGYIDKATKTAEPLIDELMDAKIQKAGDDSKAGGE